MKKRLLIALSIILILIAGCAVQPTQTPTTQPTPEQTAEETPTQTTPATETQKTTDTKQEEPTSKYKPATTNKKAIIDTSQDNCYDNTRKMRCPSEGADFFGQDAQYQTTTPKYKDNNDGTITDLSTGLMWQQDPKSKKTYDQAIDGAADFRLAGHDDWRIPTIKELYSLMDFRGIDPDSTGQDTSGLTPFIDTDYFNFEYGDTSTGDRIIDSQWASGTKYISTTMGGDETVFGVNFADGRIKGYGIETPRGKKTFFVIYVRGKDYGINRFKDNNDNTITDDWSGLTWQEQDSKKGMTWKDALNYCEELNLATHDDWRLPDAKELQSIVDYTRSPDATSSAAIDPIFDTTDITNEAGKKDYPFFWTGTTHVNERSADSAAYISFGRAMGYMNNVWLDVHGAGCQRSDPKSGDPDDYPTGHGPQGDARRIYNYARCVRGGAELVDVKFTSTQPTTTQQQPPTQTPPNSQGTPPPEATAACSGKSEGASCSFKAPDRTITGTCRNTPQGTACVPI
ncbi:DUF1566 domain-containing protein [Nanoarchaeota archaeon]